MGAGASSQASAALASAAARADLATLESILPDTPLKALASGDKADGWTPLHFAAGGGAASPFPLSSASADPSADAIALILFHHAEQPVGLFSLDGHPHLKSVVIDPPDLSAYRTLTQQGAAS